MRCVCGPREILIIMGTHFQGMAEKFVVKLEDKTYLPTPAAWNTGWLCDTIHRIPDY
jgi:hypothetical protein